jgi:hypothetical protein
LFCDSSEGESDESDELPQAAKNMTMVMYEDTAFQQFMIFLLVILPETNLGGHGCPKNADHLRRLARETWFITIVSPSWSAGRLPFDHTYAADRRLTIP